MAAALDFDAYRIHVGRPTARRCASSNDQGTNRWSARRKSAKRFQERYDHDTSWNPGATFRISDTHRAIVEMWYRDDGTLWVLPGDAVWRAADGTFAVFDVYDNDGNYIERVAVRGEGTAASDGLYLNGGYLFRIPRQYQREAGGEEDASDGLVLIGAAARGGGYAVAAHAGDLGIVRESPLADVYVCYSCGAMATKEKKELTLTCQVDSYRNGWTVVAFRPTASNTIRRRGGRDRVRRKWVRVNGAEVEPGHVVAKDDAVAYTIWHAEPPVDSRYDILYEDDDLLAVSKIGQHPRARVWRLHHPHIDRTSQGDFGSVAQSLPTRLDRETSGVVLLAKNKETNRGAAGAFARGEVEKRYVAVVHGSVRRRLTLRHRRPHRQVDTRFQYPVGYE